MRYFFDTEFIEYGQLIDLISIGIVADDGREYYAISRDFDTTTANDWVKKHVLSQLEPEESGLWKSRIVIKHGIIDFVGDDTPEFWAYYGAYDWVAFAQLFGRALDMPENWPYFRDLKDAATLLKVTDLPKPGKPQHHALIDARHNKVIYEFLANYSKRR